MCKFLFVFIIFISSTCYTQVHYSNKNIEAVRGVWLTNVDSDALNSKENIISTVELCDRLGFNSIFVVTWNKGMTTYPSKIMKDLIGVEIDTQFIGRDPLKELIEEAHKKNIKVIAWFEFGFSSSYQLDGGKILEKKPEWISRDVDGNLVVKNGFDWMNGFHPEVQDFLLSLIMEVVKNYKIDGIQGDDRLPAMPVESGYDFYTMIEYKKEHNGKLPPVDCYDTEWINWRADRLNKFMKRIFETVKSYNKNLIVSMAPSIYPWAKEEYLQDWLTWVKNGWVDLVIPQLYRYRIEDYIELLNDIVSNQIKPKDMKKFVPGILLKLGDYYPDEEFLIGMIKENRKRGIESEVFFFFEGIKKFDNLFKQKLYTVRASFPKLIE